MKTSTLKSKDEALGGTWENTKASAARGVGESKKGFLDFLNSVLGDTVQPAIESRPGLGTGAVTAAAAGAGIATTAGSLAALRAIMGTQSGLRMLSSIPGIATMASSASRLPVVAKGPGLFGLAAGLGGAVLSSVAGEESVVARYGSAALSGAGLGATIGSIVPILGTTVGAAVGGGLGLLVQGITEAMRPNIEQKPVDVNFKAQLGLAPGLVLQGQSLQASGGNVQMDTGNLWTGAPR